MMTRVGWIRILGLLCAGVCAAPTMMMAQTSLNQQTGTTHKSASTAGAVYKQQAPSAAQKQAPAATAPRAAQTTTQKQPAKTVQPQPAASTSSMSSPGSMYTHPITSGQPKGAATTVPAQSAPAQAQPPSMYTYKPSPSLQSKVAPTAGTTSPPATTKNPPSSGGTVGTSDGPPTAGTTSPPATTKGPPSSGGAIGTSDGPPMTGPKSPRPATSQTPTTGPNSPPATRGPSTSGGTSDGPPSTAPKPPASAQTPPSPTGTSKPPSPRGQPQTPPSPAPKPPRGPIQTLPSPPIPSYGMLPPRVHEPPPSPSILSHEIVPTPVPEPEQQPVATPPPSAPPSTPPAQPPETPQQAQQQPTPKPQTPVAPRPDAQKPQPVVEPPSDSGNAKVVVVKEPVPVLPLAALTLTTKTLRPVVGRDVVVVAALEPPTLAGASYRLNWGDGSAVETVSESGTHRYAKAKLYKVSASTVVGTSELNHEILLQVAPVVSPRIDLLMAVLAGLAACSLIGFVPKLSATFRWGAPGVPEMKLLSREPYMSLSFEPGVGPAEEDITFSKK